MARATLNKIGKGEGTVAIHHYIKVLFVLGMINRVNELADPRFDTLGLHLDEENLPQRIHLPKLHKTKE